MLLSLSSKPNAAATHQLLKVTNYVSKFRNVQFPTAPPYNVLAFDLHGSIVRSLPSVPRKKCLFFSFAFEVFCGQSELGES